MRTLLVTVPLGLLLLGCAQVPKPATYTLTYQRKMQAARHWSLLARDVAQRVISEQGALEEAGVYVQPTNGVFGCAFTSLLKTELVNGGVTLASAPTGAAVLDIEVQLIQYHARWPHRANRRHPGFWTAVGTIIRLADNMTKNMIIPAGVALDLLDGSQTTLTHHEIVVTSSLQKNGQYLMRQANMYYINDADRGQYAAVAPGLATTTGTPGQAKTLEVVAQ